MLGRTRTSRSNIRRRARDRVHPQGTLAERIRAGGAGIPAFFTRTGAGTLIAEGKEEREIDGERYVMERGLVADLSIVHAGREIRGHLVYRKTARNFNPMMATAGRSPLRGRESGRARQDRSRPHHHAGRVRETYCAHSECGEAHRAAHRAQTRHGLKKESRHGLTRDQMAERAARSCATASTSISVSAFRRWCRTTSRPA